MYFLETSAKIVKNVLTSFFSSITFWILVLLIVLAALIVDASFLINTASAEKITIKNGTSERYRGMNIFFHGTIYLDQGFTLSAYPEKLLLQVDQLNEESSKKAFADIISKLTFNNKTTFPTFRREAKYYKLQYTRDPKNVIIFDLVALSGTLVIIDIKRIY